MDNLKQHSGYFIMKSGQTEIAYWSLLQWKVDKLILQSGIFYIKIGSYETAQWLFHYEKWTIQIFTLGSLTMKIGQTDTAQWAILQKKGIILNCTVAISLWKVNNPKLHNPKTKKQKKNLNLKKNLNY